MNIILITEEPDKNENFVAKAQKLYRSYKYSLYQNHIRRLLVRKLYINDLSENFKNQIKSQESNTSFKFEDKHIIKSITKVKLVKMIYVKMVMLNLTAKETILFKTKHKPCDAELRLKLY